MPKGNIEIINVIIRLGAIWNKSLIKAKTKKKINYYNVVKANDEKDLRVAFSKELIAQWHFRLTPDLKFVFKKDNTKGVKRTGVCPKKNIIECIDNLKPYMYKYVGSA